MKTDNLTGVSYAEPEDDYSIFEDFTQTILRYNFLTNLKQSMIVANLDSSNITHDNGDFFNFASDMKIRHPISGKMITISKSVEFPTTRAFRLRDGSVFGLVIPPLMNDDMNVAIQEKTSLSRDDYSFLVLGMRYGNKVHLHNGNVIDV